MASVAFDDRGVSPDEAASRLYEEHSHWLLGFCTRQLGARSDAEDAVQVTFLYAFRALRRGVVPECARAWLTTIARNVCHTQRRTRSRHPEHATELDLDRIGLAQPDRSEVGFIDDVRAALSSLPETQRRALVLREWHGASSNEIASELHLSEPATNALLFRARKSFASAMSASGRPFAALNAAALVNQLREWAKPLLGGAAVKAAVATTAAGVVVGGAALEQRADGVAPMTHVPVPVRLVDEQSSRSVQRATEARARASASRRAPAPVTDRRRAVDVTVRPAVAPARTDAATLVRPPKAAAEPSARTMPPARELPSAPIPAPPVEVPVPAPPPVELPPILGEEPRAELPSLPADALPPVELPPVPPVPVPELPLP